MADGGRVLAQGTRPAGRQQFLNAQLRRDAEAPAPPPPEVLAGLAAQLGAGDGGAFLAAVARLHVERQHALLEHAAGVARHLQARGLGVQRMEGIIPLALDTVARSAVASQPTAIPPCRCVVQGLGVAGELVGRMLQHCPALFSHPCEVRAG